MWKNNLPLAVLAGCIIAIVGMSAYTYPSREAENKRAEQVAVSQWVAEQNAGQTAQNTDNSEQSPFWRELIAWPDGVTAVALILTLFCIAWQATLMQQTVLQADKASKIELRAYLTVLVGTATYQERRAIEDGDDLKFGADPVLVNTGQTPARKIRFKARAAFLPVPLPRETHLPEGYDENTGDSILGARQNATMAAVVDGFCQDSDIQEIKNGGFEGKKMGLYVWGLVNYEDAFGESHFTRFCQHVYWMRDGAVRGHYTPGRNDAN